MKYIKYQLTMPGVGSWNGKWTGDSRYYVKVRKYSDVRDAEKVKKILANKSYYYGWGDGWGANVKVELIDGQQSIREKRKSDGFCGYEWMIDSIEKIQKILTPEQLEAGQVSNLSEEKGE